MSGLLLWTWLRPSQPFVYDLDPLSHCQVCLSACTRFLTPHQHSHSCGDCSCPHTVFAHQPEPWVHSNWLLGRDAAKSSKWLSPCLHCLSRWNVHSLERHFKRHHSHLCQQSETLSTLSSHRVVSAAFTYISESLPPSGGKLSQASMQETL